MDLEHRHFLSVALVGFALTWTLPLLAEDDLPSWNTRESAPPASLAPKPSGEVSVSQRKPKLTQPKPREEVVTSSKPKPSTSTQPKPQPSVATTTTPKPAPATTTPAAPDLKPKAPVSTKPAGLAAAQANERALSSATNITNVATTEASTEVGSKTRPVRLNSKHTLTRPRRSKPPGHEERDETVFEPRHIAEATPAPQPAAQSIPALPNKLAKLDNRPPKIKFQRHIVKRGDTLWGLSRKYRTTVVDLKTANNLNTDTLSIGQVLLIPQKTSAVAPRPVISAIAAVTPAAKAQPIPVAPAKVAEAVAPATHQATAASWPPAPSIPTRYELSDPHSNSVLKYPNPNAPMPVMQIDGKIVLSDAQRNLVSTAQKLAKRDIDYNQGWRPPGEKERWVMDCSNTSRYLYKAATGIDLPRTASSQYYTLRLKKRAWNIPLDDEGRPSIAYMQRHLQIGDLLFWEHTYKPKRNPPITHVTIFLGTDKEGRWLMAGSQSAGRGLISNDASGPDLYVFNPHMPSGGYTGFMGMGKVKGRFVAHARPLPDQDVHLAKR